MALDLDFLARNFMSAQKQRIAVGLRLLAIEKGTTKGDKEALQTLYESCKNLEAETLRLMKKALRQHPVWPYMKNIKGIGEQSAAKLLGLLGDVNRFPTVGKLWRYSGYAVIDGKAERYRKGEKAHYNGQVRTAMYNIAESFLRSGSPYVDIYYRAKMHYRDVRQNDILERLLPEKTEAYFEQDFENDNEAKKAWDKLLAKGKKKAEELGVEPPWTDMHVHLASIRKMNKLFLAHLWEVSRKVAGLPTRDPYAIEYKGHSTIYRPEDFGWSMPPAEKVAV